MIFTVPKELFPDYNRQNRRAMLAKYRRSWYVDWLFRISNERRRQIKKRQADLVARVEKFRKKQAMKVRHVHVSK